MKSDKGSFASLLLFIACLPLPHGVPVNDRCVDATELHLNAPIEGSNADSNFDFVNQGVCGARSDRRAVWYWVRGNGNEYTVHLCSRGLPLVNFGLFNECNNQNCNGFPATNLSNILFLCQDDEAQAYSWRTTEGMRYFVHVRGEENTEFSLIVADESTAVNDLCINAKEMIVPSAVVGSTEGATHDFYSPSFCGKQSNQAGVWYKVIGNGEKFTISVCTLNNVQTSFGVFSECGNRNCSGFSDSRLARCQDSQDLSYSWITTADDIYYIHIRGEGESIFSIRIHGDTSLENDRCVNATELPLDLEITGFNGGSSIDFVDESVCGPRSDLPGVWYLITGNGYKLTASVCSNNGKQVAFGIFDGCNGSQCLGYPPSEGIVVCMEEESLTFSFDTFIDEKYYIHVRGDDGVSFMLKVEQSTAYQILSSAITSALLFFPSFVSYFIS